MSSFAWFQDGVGYGATDLAGWQSLLFPRGQFKHLFANTGQFPSTPNLGNRTVAIGAGSVFIGGPTSGGTWAYSDGGTIAVPTASNDNPRKDLIVARLTTMAADGVNGLAIQVVQGTPAATPVLPTRPDYSAVLCVIDVPKASTTFTVTPSMFNGTYTDQATVANGHLAVNWASLPVATAFPVGFTLYNIATNQRWIRTTGGTWYTTDPGPWFASTFQSYNGLSNVLTTPSGNLYIRETSTAWELQGQVNLSPSNGHPNGLQIIGQMHASVSRPLVNVFGSCAQTHNLAYGGTCRIGLLTSGAIQWGAAPTGAVGNIYVATSIPKTPLNAA